MHKSLETESELAKQLMDEWRAMEPEFAGQYVHIVTKKTLLWLIKRTGEIIEERLPRE